MKLRTAFVIVSALLLSACEAPNYTWVVNGTGERVVILRASPGRNRELNAANGSPWWWPVKTNPVLGYAHKLTSFGPDRSWEFVFQLGSSCLTFSTPDMPIDALDRPDWQIYLAYRENVFQLGADRRLYRTPAYSPNRAADVTRLPQPEGYPLSPTQTNC